MKSLVRGGLDVTEARDQSSVQEQPLSACVII